MTSEAVAVPRERITEISDSLKGWFAKSLDVSRFSPQEVHQLLGDALHGLNECLAYIEQIETGKTKYPD